MTDRELIFSRLGAAETVPNLSSDPVRIGIYSVEELWTRFESELSLLGGEVRFPDAAFDGVSGSVIADGGARDWATAHGIRLSENVWEVGVGLSWGVVAVAESGTILVSTESSPTRLCSLAPLLHIVLINDCDIVLTLEDAFASYVPASNCAFVTGPSRTADIEGVLVRGIHGPQDLRVIRCK